MPTFTNVENLSVDCNANASILILAIILSQFAQCHVVLWQWRRILLDFASISCVCTEEARLTRLMSLLRRSESSADD